MTTHPILRRDHAALVADAEQTIEWLDGITDLACLVVGVTRDGRIRAWPDEETEADEIVLVDAADVLTVERDEIVTDLVEGALAAAREWTPLVIEKGLPLTEHVRFAYVTRGGDRPVRLTLVWSTVKQWCEWGRPDHLVMRPDPVVPPPIWSSGGQSWEPVSAQCGTCGTIMTPNIKILRGWWPEERIRRYGYAEGAEVV
jgi:hypothetical protein